MLQTIERDHRFVDECFHAMLRNWARRSSPPPTWIALIEALKSPVFDRGDIAKVIEVYT